MGEIPVTQTKLTKDYKNCSLIKIWWQFLQETKCFKLKQIVDSCFIAENWPATIYVKAINVTAQLQLMNSRQQNYTIHYIICYIVSIVGLSSYYKWNKNLCAWKFMQRLCCCCCLILTVCFWWRPVRQELFTWGWLPNYFPFATVTVTLTSIQSAGVAPEVNLKNSVQARKRTSEKSTLALKPGADVTRSPKQGYQWPPWIELMSSKFKKKQTKH